MIMGACVDLKAGMADKKVDKNLDKKLDKKVDMSAENQRRTKKWK